MQPILHRWQILHLMFLDLFGHSKSIKVNDHLNLSKQKFNKWYQFRKTIFVFDFFDDSDLKNDLLLRSCGKTVIFLSLSKLTKGGKKIGLLTSFWEFLPNSVHLMKNLLRLTGSWPVAYPSASIHCSTLKSSPGWPFPFPFSHSSFPASWPPSTRWHSTTTWTKFLSFFTPVHLSLIFFYPERGQEWTFLTRVRDIHIECSKQFKWILCFYGSGLSGPFLAEPKLL